MFKDLQIQILEDVVTTGQNFDRELFPKDSYSIFHAADVSRRIQRRRPEEMLDTLRVVLAEDTERVWPMEELLARLGWQDTKGGRLSVGQAVAFLGNKVSTQVKPKSEPVADLSDRILATAFDDCTSAELCARLGLPETKGLLTRVGTALSKLGWKRYKTRKVGGGALWRWRKS